MRLIFIVGILVSLTLPAFTSAQEDTCDFAPAIELLTEATTLREYGHIEQANLLVAEAMAIQVRCGADGVNFMPVGTFVTRNAEWTPSIQEFDGVEMALVPAGCFTMGSTQAQMDSVSKLGIHGQFLSDSQPTQIICFTQPFWIDVYEVTEEQRSSEPLCFQASDEPNQASRCASWFDAVEYCEARNARLLTEAEWEYAARGPDALIYPWGNEFDNTALNYCNGNCRQTNVDESLNDGYDMMAPVGSFPADQSWIGAMDMAGNVSEWTSTSDMSYPYNSFDGREDMENAGSYRIIRGGDFASSSDVVNSILRGALTSSDNYFTAGIRCARDYE